MKPTTVEHICCHEIKPWNAVPFLIETPNWICPLKLWAPQYLQKMPFELRKMMCPYVPSGIFNRHVPMVRPRLISHIGRWRGAQAGECTTRYVYQC
jgi:hypothetical protein